MEPRVSGVPCWWDFKPPFLSFPSCLLFCISQKESSVLFPFGSVEFPLVGLFEINKPDLLPLKHLSAAFLDANITGHRLSWMLRCRAQTEIKEDCGQIKRPESRLKTDGDSIRKRRRIISPSLSPSVGVWPSKYLSKQLRHRKLVIFIFLCFHTHTHVQSWLFVTTGLWKLSVQASAKNPYSSPSRPQHPSLSALRD